MENSPAYFNTLLKEKNIDSSAFHRLIFENVDCLLYVKSVPDLRYSYVSNSFLSLLGLNSEDIIEKKAEDVFPKDQAQYYELKEREAIEKKEVVEIMEDIIRDRNHILRMLHTKKIPIWDNEGTVQFIITLSIDKTDKQLSAMELEENTTKFTAFFELSPFPSSIVRCSDLTILAVNRAYCQTLGYDKNEVIGKKITDLTTWKEPFIRDELIQKILAIKSSISREVEIIDKFGNSRTMLVSIEYVKSEFEKEPWLIFIGIDISERKKAEREIQELLKKEKEINNFKSRFVSLITHELRNPLTTIMLSTDLLRNHFEDCSEQEREEQFQRIQNTILNMTQLMEKILTLGNMDMGKYKFQPEAIDIPAFFKSLADSVQFMFNNTRKINTTFAGECTFAEADETLLSLIINNLLTNACKYSPENSTVEFHTIFEPDYITVSIKDYGIGIPEADLPFLFDAFYRASNAKKISGYGIGLSIVKKCIELHKGKIEVNSKINEGTTFNLTIPIKFSND